MTKRNSVLVLVLMVVTLTIYWFYWIYVTTDELKRESGDTSINPALDLVLCILTCGLWGLFVEYRNAQVIHRVLVARGRTHDDKSTLILVLNISALFVGVTGFIPPIILQEDYNLIAEPAPAVVL